MKTGQSHQRFPRQSIGAIIIMMLYKVSAPGPHTKESIMYVLNLQRWRGLRPCSRNFVMLYEGK